MRNAVPAEVTFSGEFRSRNIETVDSLRMQLQATMEQARKRYGDATIQEELEVMFHMYDLDPNDPIVRMVTRVMGDMGLNADIQPSGGGTDANAMRLNGIDCVVVGMSTYGMHTVNEYVLIPDLINTARFCERVMEAR